MTSAASGVGGLGLKSFSDCRVRGFRGKLSEVEGGRCGFTK